MLLPLLLAAAAIPGGDTVCPAVARHWLRQGDRLPEHRVVLSVRLRGRAILWDGRPISRPALRRALERSRRMSPTPFILFDPEGARNCRAAAEVRDLIDSAAGCGRGVFCGQRPNRAWSCR